MNGFHSPPRVGVLIVAYNAAATIDRVLGRIQPTTWDRISEVFIFDDSSGDDTVAVAARHRADQHLGKVRIFRNQVNLGYGGNQKRGYRYAIQQGFDIVVLLHGDGQYAPEVMDRLIDPIANGEADAVFGSRMLIPGAARQGGMPLYKFVGNKILTHMQNSVLGLDLSEYHSGYRAYRVSALEQTPYLKNSNDFHFDNEIILQLDDAGQRIREVPIPTYYGGEICYVNGLGYAWNVFRTTVRHRLHHLGLLSAPQFDRDGGVKYSFKRNRHSRHMQLLNMMERAGAGQRWDVLDIGCGAGLLASRIAEMGHRVVGIDAFDCPEARENCDRFIVAEIEDDFGLRAHEKFDCILLADVLEHVSEPERVLLRARRLLKPGGRIMASTGNVAHWFIRAALLCGRFSYTERGILDRTHRRLFTRGTFAQLFADCGFKVTARRSTPIPFEHVLPSFQGAADALCTLNMLAAKVWPSLFAYQTVLEADLDSRATELLRADEIERPDYVEFGSLESHRSQAA